MTNQHPWPPFEPQHGVTTNAWHAAPPAAPNPYAPPTPQQQVIATTGFGPVSGYPAQPPFGYVQQYPALIPQRNNGMAVASMVLGIVGLLVSWFLLGIPSILAVVFGHVSLHQIRQSSHVGGRGMAIGGLVTGYLGIAGGILFLVVNVAMAFFGV
jgi:hypothetical protein